MTILVMVMMMMVMTMAMMMMIRNLVMLGDNHASNAKLHQISPQASNLITWHLDVTMMTMVTMAMIMIMCG